MSINDTEAEVTVYAGSFLPSKGHPILITAGFFDNNVHPVRPVGEFFGLFSNDPSTFLGLRIKSMRLDDESLGSDAERMQDEALFEGECALRRHLDKYYSSRDSRDEFKRVELNIVPRARLVGLYAADVVRKLLVDIRKTTHCESLRDLLSYLEIIAPFDYDELGKEPSRL